MKDYKINLTVMSINMANGGITRTPADMQTATIESKLLSREVITTIRFLYYLNEKNFQHYLL